jgi:hypothetical protein
MDDLFLLSEMLTRRVNPYFPLSHGIARVDDRRVASGIVFVIRNGLHWRDAPVRATRSASQPPNDATWTSVEVGRRHGGGRQTGVPSLVAAGDLLECFHRMLWARDTDAPTPWLADAAKSPLASFGKELMADLSTVKAALVELDLPLISGEPLSLALHRPRTLWGFCSQGLNARGLDRSRRYI